MGGCRVKFHSQDDQGSIRFMQQATRRQNELTIAPPTEDVQGYLTIASSRWFLVEKYLGIFDF